MNGLDVMRALAIHAALTRRDASSDRYGRYAQAEECLSEIMAFVGDEAGKLREQNACLCVLAKRKAARTGEPMPLLLCDAKSSLYSLEKEAEKLRAFLDEKAA